MIPIFLGFKKKQTQQFSDKGVRIPVTLISAGPCYVTRISEAGINKLVEIGFGDAKHICRPMEGYLKKAGLTKKLRFLRSFLIPTLPENMKVGTELSVTNVLAPGDKVAVTAKSKGKGFAGVVKRHGFHGGPRTHGQSDRERAPGSIGQTTTPGRVYRGKRMAGRMGGEMVTVKNLRVVSVSENGEVVLKGVVPGGVNSMVVIRKELK